MIPFLSTMVKKKSSLHFQSADGNYIMIVKPRVGILVLYFEMLFSDSFWKDDTESENYYQTLNGLKNLQIKKLKDGRILNELKKIEEMALKHHIESEHVLFLDTCGSKFSIDDLSNLLHQALDKNISFEVFKKNQLWPGFSNVSGSLFTEVFVKHVWGHEIDLSMV